MKRCNELQNSDGCASPQCSIINGSLIPDITTSQDISDWLQHLAQAFGVRDKEAAVLLLSQLASANYQISSNNTETINGLIAALSEMEPDDPAESMLAIQMITCHTQVMKMLARITKAGGPTGSEVVQSTLKIVDRLMRTYTMQMEALSRYRRKGMQKMTVEHITVENGGQAIVGSINRGGANDTRR